MNPIFEYKCSQCGSFHEGTPSLAYAAPLHYVELSEEEKKERVRLKTDDFCVIENDHFIRVCLEIPILGMDEGFLWGIWVSLSENNFNEYHRKFHDEYSADYFGWFCNNLPYYGKTLSIPTTVRIIGNKSRPLISINSCDHEIFNDYQNGIPKEKAIRILEGVRHNRDKKK